MAVNPQRYEVESRTALRPVAAPVAGPSAVLGNLGLVADHLVLFLTLVIARTVLHAVEPAVAAFVVIFLAALVWPDLGKTRLTHSVIDDVAPVMRRATLSFAATSALVVVTGIGSLEGSLLTAVVAAPLVLAGRGVAYAVERELASARPHRTIVVGAGEVARRLIAALQERDEYAMEVVGAVDSDPKLDAKALGTRVLGGIDDLGGIVGSHRVDRVIVAFTNANEAETMKAVRAASEAGASVWLVPRMFELGMASGSDIDHVWGYPLVQAAQSPSRRPHWVAKRTFDVVTSGFGLLLLSPLLALIALALLIEDGKPLLFRQVRLTRSGRPFEILKFRTMKVCNDDVKNTEWAADEDRITRVGRFLRDTGLDEVPQLFNVLVGDMSLVGPRPERPFFVADFSSRYDNYDARHRVATGVTGWSQIHGLRGDTSIEDRALLDNYYIDNWSLGKDLKIMVRTIPTLFGNTQEEE